MRLKSICYRENYSTEGVNPWELEKLILGERNLIVGKNATGKTRIINVINNLSRLIKTQQLYNGEWIASFTDESDYVFEFSVSCESGKIIKEQILVNDKKKLDRTPSSAQIFSETALEWQTISPPHDRLVLHVRRDEKEFPFLENLVAWAERERGFSFANTSPNFIEIPGNPFHLTSLNAVPTVLEELSEFQIQKILKQLEDMGYEIDSAMTGLLAGLPPAAKIIYFKEKGIPFPLKQFEISQGMFRAFSMLIIIEYLVSKANVGSVLVDDLGEGLDFERTKKLAQNIFGNTNNSKSQIIATSNDSFLMNTVPLTDLIICNREQHIVKCLNYSNSKEKFDNWRQLGLNNFDLLSTNYLLKN